jgi:hypothetical protein
MNKTAAEQRAFDMGRQAHSQSTARDQSPFASGPFGNPKLNEEWQQGWDAEDVAP